MEMTENPVAAVLDVDSPATEFSQEKAVVSDVSVEPEQLVNETELMRVDDMSIAELRKEVLVLREKILRTDHQTHKEKEEERVETWLLWRAPKPRPAAEERNVSTNEVLFDVCIAAVLGAAAESYHGPINENKVTVWTSMYALAFVFSPIWLFWLIFTHDFNLFDQNDGAHYCVFMLMLLLGTYSSDSLALDNVEFITAFSDYAFVIMGARFLNGFHELYIYIFNRELFGILIRSVCSFFVGFLWMIMGFTCKYGAYGGVNATFFDGWIIRFLWTGLIVIDVVLTMLSFTLNLGKLPAQNSKHMSERIMLFVMLCVGEIFNQNTDKAEDIDAYTLSKWQAGAAGVFLALIIKFLYVEFEPEAKSDTEASAGGYWKHAFGTTTDWRGVVWVFLHLPLQYFIILLAGTATILPANQSDAFYFQGICFGAVVLILTWMHMCHKPPVDHLQRAPYWVRIMIRHAFGVILVLFPWMGWVYADSATGSRGPEDLQFWQVAGEISIMAVLVGIDGYLSGPPGSLLHSILVRRRLIEKTN